MTSKQRMLAAINGGKPDRLPFTTHHLMPYFLNRYFDGKTGDRFFQELGFDAIKWTMPLTGNEPRKTCYDNCGESGSSPSEFLMSPEWKITREEIAGQRYPTFRYYIETPRKTLTATLQSNEYTTWISEHPVKEDCDIDIIADYMPVPLCDVSKLSDEYEAFGELGLVRSHIPGFELFGQPGCWQDACCMVGTEKMIMQSIDDPDWAHTLLEILKKKKLEYIASLSGAKYDLIELGGGDASTTVISPCIFNEFVAPYDAELIAEAHRQGQKIVYHICGGKSPILEDIVAMKPDAVETFTPKSMGGDTVLSEAKKRIGGKCCMIGGFDQGHYFIGCSAEETRQAVRQCFEDAGTNGGYILSPSDHFFDADIGLLKAFAEEARNCPY